MELEKITQILKTHNNVVFGLKNPVKDNDLGLYYIFVNVEEKTVKFTSDTSDYLMFKKLEEVMEKLFSEFEIKNYNIQFHVHEADWHDKDVTLQLKDVNKINNLKEISKIIKFIQDNFYKELEWDFSEYKL